MAMREDAGVRTPFGADAGESRACERSSETQRHARSPPSARCACSSHTLKRCGKSSPQISARRLGRGGEVRRHCAPARVTAARVAASALSASARRRRRPRRRRRARRRARAAARRRRAAARPRSIVSTSATRPFALSAAHAGWCAHAFRSVRSGASACSSVCAWSPTSGASSVSCCRQRSSSSGVITRGGRDDDGAGELSRCPSEQFGEFHAKQEQFGRRLELEMLLPTRSSVRELPTGAVAKLASLNKVAESVDALYPQIVAEMHIALGRLSYVKAKHTRERDALQRGVRATSACSARATRPTPRPKRSRSRSRSTAASPCTSSRCSATR